MNSSRVHLASHSARHRRQFTSTREMEGFEIENESTLGEKGQRI